MSEIAHVNRSQFSKWLRSLFRDPPDDGDRCLYMMHFAGTLMQANVVVQDIRECNRRLRINNSKDLQKTMLSPHQIRRNICNIIENPSPIGQYNLLTNNCEDFANYIRYGIRESDQILYYMAYSGDVLFYLLLFGFLLFACFANWYATMNLAVLLLLLYVLHIYEPISHNLYAGAVLTYLWYFSFILFVVYTDWDLTTMFTVALVVLAIMVYLKTFNRQL